MSEITDLFDRAFYRMIELQNEITRLNVCMECLKLTNDTYGFIPKSCSECDRMIPELHKGEQKTNKKPSFENQN